MRTKLEMENFELIVTIVNCGGASKVLRIARAHGVPGGTIFIGRGTAPPSPVMEILGLNDIRKEILLMAAEKDTVRRALEQMRRQLKLDKPNHGIAFTMPLVLFLGAGDYEFAEEPEWKEVKNPMFQCIFTIVEKGHGELVMDAATKAGARGGTIINARGAGVHEAQSLFAMDIEPEKEVVLILTESTLTTKIVSAIRDDLEIDKPGRGIIFVQNVNETYGLRQ